MSHAPLSLAQLHALDADGFTAALDGIYEHSPWIARAAWAQRPFHTLPQLKAALAKVVREASEAEQLALIRAHPELAGKAAVAGALTAESTDEQSRAGLTHCSPEQFALLQQLNADYNARFGWPFILAVRGPRGQGLSREQIIATFQRRLRHTPEFERAECLRHIHRIAEIRLNDRFGLTPTLGNQVWDWAEALAAHTEGLPATEGGPCPLTVTYMSTAHQACARQLVDWMRDAGFDEVGIDAVGNVVGRYHGSDPQAPALLTGSHYDTVRNGGKYDGRLGILVPMACVRELHRQGRRLRHGIEVVGFAEEEGQRYAATFLGSGALVGDFKPAWLDQVDAEGITMRQALQAAGFSASLDDIAALRRDPARYLGFVEVHIEQGPVLDEHDMPLGIVTSINGVLRMTGTALGTACHAGTTPMGMRQDAALAVAELMLYTEQRARQDSGSPAGASVGTVGVLHVPQGSINVVPGRCDFTLDLRAPTNEQRDALARDVLACAREVAKRRGVEIHIQESVRASASPSHPAWQARWEAAVQRLGLPLFHLPSGAGHDAMKLHEILPQAMLFVRGGHAGISHNPLETITNDDAQLCVDAFMHLLESL
ncbi:MAG TPA: 2-oxo-4-hydroxy-4-carboxy-5-ureidoimidazoline decarboxylase [Aquabacterium sp.]|uniref:2-oxo-4-hydroxy-4-carboxy-5-ureidoimidazoline decarboxylase n=1 Tax=Aquabacterium sp. TaxID=1872578 RepID=UPI002E35174B|nr:2-oxo-4-hydroxy-4-carboxy-5-ureidoimidazoline decarboxylase [Aquabacterium sp.]HEX5371376.1 2-oxo-4-hydroxy-4-carboxy-5-ureidoimidazoline decarboxylase [Aquabacterium sp.]